MTKQLFIRLDVDNAGDSIELALLNSDYINAQNIHNRIQNNIDLVFKKLQDNNSVTILMKGCDDILFSINEENYDYTFLKNLKNEFNLHSNFTLSIGIGDSINESMLNLRKAKISGKNKIVGNNNS